MKEKNSCIPNFFKPLLWSYKFDKLNAENDKKLIIVNAINYGDLKHWQWLNKFYGRKTVAAILSKIPASELRERVRELAGIIFKIKKFNYAPRGY